MSGETTLGPGAARHRPDPVATLGERLREGGAYVLTGEPGSGRSTVLARIARAFDAGPAVVVPARPEPFRQPLAGLRALCRAAGVPDADAAGPVPDLAGALRATAASGTVLLCVDDADRWDTASRTALGRLAALLAPGGGIALVLTVAGFRPVDPEFAGLPLLRLAPLSAPDAAALLAEAAPGALDPRVREEITAAAEGNPGLLLGVVHRLTPAQLGGIAPLPCPLVAAETLAALAGRHLTGLPPAQRDLLLVTAAAVQVPGEPTAATDVVRHAAARLAAAGPCPDPFAHALAHAPAHPRAEHGSLPGGGLPRQPGPCPEPGPQSESAAGAASVPGGGPDSLSETLPQGGPIPGHGPVPRPAPHGTGDDRFPPGGIALPEALYAAEGRVGFRSTVLCRAVYAGASAERRRAAHEALARTLPGTRGLPALLHRSWAVTAPAPALAAALASVAADPASAAPPAQRCTAYTRAAELAPDGVDHVRWYTAAAEQALLAGQSARALRLLDTARCRPAPAPVRARAELLRGTALRWDGPVDDARETLLLAAALSAPHDPERSAEAALAAADAAWSAGDVAACLRALTQGRWWTGTHRAGKVPGAALTGRSLPGTPPPSADRAAAERAPGAGGGSADASVGHARPVSSGRPGDGRGLDVAGVSGSVGEVPSGSAGRSGDGRGFGRVEASGSVGQARSVSAGRPGGGRGFDVAGVPGLVGEVPSGSVGRAGDERGFGRVEASGSVGQAPPVSAAWPGDGRGLDVAGAPGSVGQVSPLSAVSPGDEWGLGTAGTPGPLGHVPPVPAEWGPAIPEAPGSGLPGQAPSVSTPPAAGALLAGRGLGAVAALRDHRAGMRAVLQGRFDLAAAPLRRVVERAWTADDPEELLRAASAALLLGDTAAARRSGARALAVARTHGSALHETRALEYLAYGELRAGRHALARAHAEEGLRSSYRAGLRNTAAHHHAVLALAASIAGEAHTVAEHATAAMTTARRHGLAQAAALAQWALARADLGHGRPREAAERLAPLVRPGSGRGHFAVWMLAVPCYVEACALARQPEGAGDAVEDFALWAACDADPQAPAQLLRCRALLAPAEAADALYRQALRRHGEGAGDFERARTELLYGKWLRRRRRLREARTHLRAALLGFERCGAGPWAQQAAAELRANGVTGSAGVPGADGPAAGVPGDAVRADGLARLTPQQLRIARRVAQGLTNREVALSLSVSTRTVDYHLRNVFAALGVRSRMELARLVAQAGQTVAQP
ncbi:LuxR C-terminal-related transcriptional regulator [Streptomyces sp. CSDS2]|uniref:LuxR C-terminal-related transcriptional regulator n=1 Tax=Streptomyces sp. CSDS2 TaxID=3055051 RepID=UPI0025B06270|nr:LuxR C-terminal-related transcriptional regulator [Streptomyces sp. CSDS2]MDN3258646.1 LuxR C-terminal-related transcriptional regulator [Streptomyces sp. CSDS2]